MITILKCSRSLCPNRFARLLSCWLSSNVMALGQSSEPHRLFLGLKRYSEKWELMNVTRRETQVQTEFRVQIWAFFERAVSACIRVQTGVFVFV